jgi:hypothetical protein
MQLGFLTEGVILSAAVSQAERRISRLTGLERKPNRTTNQFSYV